MYRQKHRNPLAVTFYFISRRSEEGNRAVTVPDHVQVIIAAWGGQRLQRTRTALPVGRKGLSKPWKQVASKWHVIYPYHSKIWLPSPVLLNLCKIKYQNILLPCLMQFFSAFLASPHPSSIHCWENLPHRASSSYPLHRWRSLWAHL